MKYAIYDMAFPFKHWLSSECISILYLCVSKKNPMVRYIIKNNYFSLTYINQTVCAYMD